MQIGIGRFCHFVVAIVFASTALTNAVFADHTNAPGGVALVGSLQSELGCPGDWQPECGASELVFNGTVWQATFFVPGGNWEYKVALNDTWDENYGADGVPGGGNIGLQIAAGGANVTFRYDHTTHAISDNAPLVQPDAVTIAGSLQDELGCTGDWQPDCANTHLTYDPDDTVWQGVFNLPAGNWEYKAPINNGWDENYGQNATRNGANIPLSLAAASTVKFFYEHGSHWITDNVNSIIATAPGSFQSELGCPGDWQPDCLRSWLQDPDGDGVYSFSTTDLPAGNYETKVAIDESWAENYGAGGTQNGPNIPFTVLNDNDLVVFSYDPVSHILTLGGSLPVGNIDEARAYWLSEDTLAWDVPAGTVVELHYSDNASLATGIDGLTGGTAIELLPSGVIDGEIAAKFRHLSGLPAFKIPAGSLTLVPDILKQQFAVSASNADGEAIDATAIQHAGVLDELYTWDGELGVTYDDDTPSIRLWAPTARSVSLHLYDDANNSIGPTAMLPMQADPGTGTWFVQGDPSWDRKYYRFEVEVYTRATGNIEFNSVTDPYSLSLSMNSKRSQFVNLDDEDLMPDDWDEIRKRRFAAPEDIAIYELHVRDFSIGDESVPEELRGTFMAFADDDSDGMEHLERLSYSGMTHIHLLPSFDCASVPENRAEHQTVGDLSGFAPDSTEQQAAVEAIRDRDGFNWCYDPFHYTVPEGSFATVADGAERILQFREMVAGLDEIGLRVIMDVVYNHTNGSLQGEKSVLDKIVPDYYHRLNNAGFIEMSSCCANTATEHNMMEKLMLDSLRIWATAYKVDGFRFDLMGHHSRVNIEKARDSLQSLTLDEDGVDGRSIYLYGEGWNFGEVANDQRFVQATQINMGDNTGVGTFNDRVRDGIRGGGPFDSGIDHVRTQGFINGLYYDPNLENFGGASELEELLRLSDWVRIGLAGSVADFTFVDRHGNLTRAGDVGYLGQGGAGYTSDPQESINYAASHDNETLFDINQYKLPLDTSTADRVRVQNLANSILALSQGIPLFHAGQDMLRSKSLDRNSYDSGDWFNILDFTYQQNGWARGLPREGDNAANWPVASVRLADPSLGVERRDILRAHRHMREMLWIRKTSRLFRLRTGDDVVDQVAFHNTGPQQIPGVIAMSLGTRADIVVVVNASTEDQKVPFDSGASRYYLHPVQRWSGDRIVRSSQYDRRDRVFDVPARTTAVFLARGFWWSELKRRLDDDD